MNPLVVPITGVKFKSAFMSSEYFKRTSLHLVRLKIQIQRNCVGRNFVTESRVNSWLITHARMHTEMNLKSTTTNGSTFE